MVVLNGVFFHQEISKVNWTKDEIASLVGKECINLKIEDSRVCHGVVRVFRVSGNITCTDVYFLLYSYYSCGQSTKGHLP